MSRWLQDAAEVDRRLGRAAPPEVVAAGPDVEESPHDDADAIGIPGLPAGVSWRGYTTVAPSWAVMVPNDVSPLAAAFDRIQGGCRAAIEAAIRDVERGLFMRCYPTFGGVAEAAESPPDGPDDSGGTATTATTATTAAVHPLASGLVAWWSAGVYAGLKCPAVYGAGLRTAVYRAWQLRKDVSVRYGPVLGPITPPLFNPESIRAIRMLPFYDYGPVPLPAGALAAASLAGDTPTSAETPADDVAPCHVVGGAAAASPASTDRPNPD